MLQAIEDQGWWRPGKVVYPSPLCCCWTHLYCLVPKPIPFSVFLVCIDSNTQKWNREGLGAFIIWVTSGGLGLAIDSRSCEQLHFTSVSIYTVYAIGPGLLSYIPPASMLVHMMSLTGWVFPGLPHSSFATFPLLCIIINTNWITKTTIPGNKVNVYYSTILYSSHLAQSERWQACGYLSRSWLVWSHPPFSTKSQTRTTLWRPSSRSISRTSFPYCRTR